LDNNSFLQAGARACHRPSSWILVSVKRFRTETSELFSSRKLKMEWWQWGAIGLIVVLVVGLKMYRDKTMR